MSIERVRGWVVKRFVLLAVVVGALFGTGCSQEQVEATICYTLYKKGRLGEFTSLPSAKNKLGPKVFERSLGIVGHKKKDGASIFARAPMDLYDGFEVELTMGVMSGDGGSKTPPPGENAITGLEFDSFADLSNPGKTLDNPLCFWGLFFRYISGGMQIFASSHEGNHGDIFFPGALLLDVRAVMLAGILTFYARDHAIGGSFLVVAAIAVTLAAFPLFPGFGMFNSVHRGFAVARDARVVKRGNVPSRSDPRHRAVDHLFAGMGHGLEAVYAINGCFSFVSLALNFIELCLIEVEAALSELRSSSSSSSFKKTPEQKAIAKLESAVKQLQSAKKKLEKKDVNGMKSAQRKLFKASKLALDASDLILPQELRDQLP